jgi:hypothetical protein
MGGGGAPGPQGETGATGPQGATGAQGPIGLPGTAFIFEGTWVSGTTYPKNALAISPADRNTYVALQLILNSVIDPSTDPLWELYTLGGIQGAQGPTGAQGIPGSGANAQFWANFQATQDVKMGTFNITKPAPGGKLFITCPAGISIDGANDLISLNAGNIILTQNNAINSLYLGAQTAINQVAGAGIALSAGASVSIQSALATLINAIGAVAITAGGAVTIQALGACSMSAVGAINIGSGASYTTIEGVYLDNNLIDRYNNGDDIEIKHIHLIQNSIDGNNGGTISIDARKEVQISATNDTDGNKNTVILINGNARTITLGNFQDPGTFTLNLASGAGGISASVFSGNGITWSSSSGNIVMNGIDSIPATGTISALQGTFTNFNATNVDIDSLKITGLTSETYPNYLVYDLSTGVVGYSSTTPPPVSIPALTPIAVSTTPIALLPAMKGQIIVLTGVGATQPFSTTGLSVGDAGFYITVHNGNGVNGGDVNMSGMTGTNVLHERTNVRNNGTAYLYWNGTSLTGY